MASAKNKLQDIWMFIPKPFISGLADTNPLVRVALWLNHKKEIQKNLARLESEKSEPYWKKIQNPWAALFQAGMAKLKSI